VYVRRRHNLLVSRCRYETWTWHANSTYSSASHSLRGVCTSSTINIHVKLKAPKNSNPFFICSYVSSIFRYLSCHGNGSRVPLQFPVELLRKSELKEWILLVCARSKSLLRANRTIGSRRTHFRNNSTGNCKITKKV
jgi:hypothetical protein